MIKLENYEVMGWEHAIRGMRNPMNSWEKSDSKYGCYLKDSAEYLGIELRDIDSNPVTYCNNCTWCAPLCEDRPEIRKYLIGPNDRTLMTKLANAGPVHGKFRRMIAVYVDITAPLYWWKEFDTYKVGTVANSCSTMHKIHSKKFEMSDFSTDHLLPPSYKALGFTVKTMNEYRDMYLNYDALKKENDIVIDKKQYWQQMIQLLPSSYNQKRTIMLNYEVLSGIYEYRKDHKLDEWRELCKWIESLPYSELITGLRKEEDK